MELKKVIKSCEIKNEYKEFVEQFLQRASKALGMYVHSIYICGSIPKGKAELYKSDADFTIVCTDLVSNDDKEKIDKIKSELMNEYPFVTKIDTTMITISDVNDKPLEWGFWIKIICHCIYGVDLGETVPQLIANSDLIINLSSDVEESINRLKNNLEKCQDDSVMRKILRVYSKRLIRGLFTVFLNDVGEWHDDIAVMKDSLSIHMKEESQIVDQLYLVYNNRQMNKLEFERLGELASNIIYRRLEELVE